MDDSKFNLWRACFAFCSLDGSLQKEELAWIEEKFRVLKFSPSQKDLLLKDLKAPPSVDTLLPLITAPADRGFLINNIRLLAMLDHNMSSSEAAKIEQMKNAVMSRIDLSVIPLDPETDTEMLTDRRSSLQSVVKKFTKLF